MIIFSSSLSHTYFNCRLHSKASALLTLLRTSSNTTSRMCTSVMMSVHVVSQSRCASLLLAIVTKLFSSNTDLCCRSCDSCQAHVRSIVRRWRRSFEGTYLISISRSSPILSPLRSNNSVMSLHHMHCATVHTTFVTMVTVI